MRWISSFWEKPVHHHPRILADRINLTGAVPAPLDRVGIVSRCLCLRESGARENRTPRLGGGRWPALGQLSVFRFSVKWRGSVPPLVSVPPLRGGDFQGIGSTDPMCFGEERERQASAPNIVSMSPPSYPSAWLHPCRARFRFAWQSHCSSPAHATFCRRFWRCWRASSSLRSRAAWISA